MKKFGIGVELGTLTFSVSAVLMLVYGSIYFKEVSSNITTATVLRHEKLITTMTNVINITYTNETSGKLCDRLMGIDASIKSVKIERSGDLICTQELESQKVIQQYSTYVNNAHIRVNVTVGIEVEELEPVIRGEVQRLMVYLFSFIVLMLISQNMIVSRKVRTPLNKIRNFATQIGSGDLNTRVGLDVNNEFRELAQVLDKMRQNLRDSQVRLVSTSKLATIGELATGVSHEVSQPLTFVSAACQELENRILNHEDLSGIDMRNVNQQIHKICETVGHLLQFGRKDDTQYSVFSPVNPINMALSLIGERVRNKGIDIKVLCTTDKQIQGDVIRLEQVFINLIQNSVHALSLTEHPKIMVRIEDSLNGIQFVFSDNGTGVSQDQQDKVFDPFFTTKQVGEGTGLGLTLSQDIVQSHGGSISLLDSVDGQGATFVIQLPVAL